MHHRFSNTTTTKGIVAKKFGTRNGWSKSLKEYEDMPCRCSNSLRGGEVPNIHSDLQCYGISVHNYMQSLLWSEHIGWNTKTDQKIENSLRLGIQLRTEELETGKIVTKGLTRFPFKYQWNLLMSW